MYMYVNVLETYKVSNKFSRYIAYTVNRVVYLMADDHDDDDLDICLFISKYIQI